MNRQFDLTDARWSLIMPLPARGPRAARRVEHRRVLNRGLPLKPASPHRRHEGSMVPVSSGRHAMGLPVLTPLSLTEAHRIPDVYG